MSSKIFSNLVHNLKSFLNNFKQSSARYILYSVMQSRQTRYTEYVDGYFDTLYLYLREELR